jgi:PAS domain S-box-containing protein
MRNEGPLDAEEPTALRRARLLADLALVLAREPGDLGSTLRAVVRGAGEPLGDAGAVWLVAPGGEHLEARAAWNRPGAGGTPADATAPGAPTTDDVPQDPPDEPPDDPPARSAVESLSGAGPLERVAGPGRGEPVGARGLRLPLRARGSTLGALDVVRAADRPPFSAEEVSLAEELAAICGSAIDTALLLAGHAEALVQLTMFRALAEASPNLIALSQAGGGTVYVNPRMAERGVDPPASEIWETVRTYVGEDRMADIRGTVESTGRWSGDLVVPTSRQELILSVDVFALVNADTGASVGAALIARDVTTLRGTERAFRTTWAELQRFRALVEASSDFIAMAALDGRVLYVNPAGRAAVGLTPDADVTTTKVADYLTPEGLEDWIAVEEPAIREQGHWEGVSTLRDRKGGPPIHVAIASFLMYDDRHEPFALATVRRDITERIAYEDALRELVVQREELLARLVEAQAQERAEIARDIHDDTVQILAAVDLRLGLLRRRLDQKAADLADVLDPVADSVARATDRLRALLFSLEPPDLAAGLAAALRSAADEIFRDTPTRWAVDGDAEPATIGSTSSTAFRIAREAMINVRKHAEAATVQVTVAGRHGGLEVSIADDGVGIGPGPVQSSSGHHGITSMRDRADIAGGTWEIRARPQGGTEVVFWLPIAPPSTAEALGSNPNG